jgi:hypothetical protein
MVVTSVSGVRRCVSLISAGWLPQDGLFGVSGTATRSAGEKGVVLINQTRVRLQR